MKIAILLTLVSISLISCYKHPEACFQTDTIQYTVNENIQFFNCSENYDEVIWDFGDGTKSTEITPSKAYNSGGIYLVELTAYTDNGKEQDSYISSIVIGERYIENIQINNLRFTDSLGNNWDNDGTGPDIQLFIEKLQSGDKFYTKQRDNLNHSRLPYIWQDIFSYNSPNPIDVKISDEMWKIDLYDMDTGPEDLMATWTVNPYAGNFPTTLKKDDIEILINWEIK